MGNMELDEIFKEKNITILEEVKFSSENLKIEFLKKLDEIMKKGSKIEFVNNDIVEIILQTELSEENLDILKRLNWDDFKKTFTEKNKDSRNKKIYDNFIIFLKAELKILRLEKPINDKTLVEKIVGDKIERLNPEIFKKQEKFDIEEDTRKKAEKYNVDILFDYKEPSKKISVNDFTLYFTRRLQYFTNLLQGRINMENVVRISQLKDLYDTNTPVSLIGLISDMDETKNGHIMITLEDRSGQIKCFVNKEKADLIKTVKNFCLDEGIGINGKVGKEIIWVDEFIIPSPPNSVELKKTEEEHYVGFLSDIHFGAKVFQDEAFQKMIDFLNQETENEKLNKIASKIKYIIIAGDLIEGIGIYPDQGKDARILSTELQYHEAAMWLSQIPKHIGIIIIPGNHDTNRLSEPQPKLPYEKAYALYNMPNTIHVSNPAIVNLFPDDFTGGLNYYIYHGGSLFYYADKIQHLREKGGAKAPEEVVKFLLEKRHLAPSHGSTLYVPDSQNDPLVIKKMPDFFITGHTHKLSLSNYKGCTIISCGCWVEMSDYQEKMGMYPDIGKFTIVNTKTRKPSIISFYTELHKRDKK